MRPLPSMSVRPVVMPAKAMASAKVPTLVTRPSGTAATAMTAMTGTRTSARVRAAIHGAMAMATKALTEEDRIATPSSASPAPIRALMSGRLATSAPQISPIAESAASGVRVSVVNPGMVQSGFFDGQDFRPGEAPENHIRPGDVAEAVLLTLSAPPGTVVDEINLSPLKRVVRFGEKDSAD